VISRRVQLRLAQSSVNQRAGWRAAANCGVALSWSGHFLNARHGSRAQPIQRGLPARNPAGGWSAFPDSRDQAPADSRFTATDKSLTWADVVGRFDREPGNDAGNALILSVVTTVCFGVLYAVRSWRNTAIMIRFDPGPCDAYFSTSSSTSHRPAVSGERVNPDQWDCARVVPRSADDQPPPAICTFSKGLAGIGLPAITTPMRKRRMP
jgi:hypothetical protein